MYFVEFGAQIIKVDNNNYELATCNVNSNNCGVENCIHIVVGEGKHKWKKERIFF